MDKVIIEHDEIREYFLKAKESGAVSHAYILEGEKGCGKKLLAEAYASILQCEEEGTKACGTCASCIQIAHRNHPDVIWVSHEKPNVITVKEIRDQVVGSVEVKPYRGPYKIYIIDEAEKLRQEAQNAILKTMEEPPEYAVVILLTTNRGMLLETIRSRAVTIPVKPVSDAGLRRYLREKGYGSEADLDFICGFAMGNIGKALEIAGSAEFREVKDHTITLLREIDLLSLYEIAQWCSQIKEYKTRIDDLLDLCTMWFRDILVLKAAKEKKRLIFSNEIVYLQKQCDILDFESVNHIVGQIEKTKKRIKANVNLEAAVELMMIQINRDFRLIQEEVW